MTLATIKLDSSDEILTRIEYMQNLRLPAGVGTHNMAAMEWTKQAGCELDSYRLSLHNLPEIDGEIYLPEDRKATCRIIQALDRTALVIKVLAVGRSDPREALACAFNHIKGQDAIVTGFYPNHQPRQVFETAALVEEVPVP